jgi:hypothetical protein
MNACSDMYIWCICTGGDSARRVYSIFFRTRPKTSYKQATESDRLLYIQRTQRYAPYTRLHSWYMPNWVRELVYVLLRELVYALLRDLVWYYLRALVYASLRELVYALLECLVNLLTYSLDNQIYWLIALIYAILRQCGALVASSTSHDIDLPLCIQKTHSMWHTETVWATNIDRLCKGFRFASMYSRNLKKTGRLLHDQRKQGPMRGVKSLLRTCFPTFEAIRLTSVYRKNSKESDQLGCILRTHRHMWKDKSLPGSWLPTLEGSDRLVRIERTHRHLQKVESLPRSWFPTFEGIRPASAYWKNA